jgi:uncharacterized protein YkwD
VGALVLLLVVFTVSDSLPQAEAKRDPIGVMLVEVNSARARLGLARLSFDPRLSRAAQAQSDDLARRGRLTHVGSGGGLVARVQRVGYHYRLVEENLAAGVADPATVVRLWLKSPGHRANLLSPHVVKAGIGYAPRGRGPRAHYWTLILARPAA